MTREGIKHKTNAKKSNVFLSNADFDTFFKNQQNIVSRLKNELKSVISEMQLSDNGTVENGKCIRELEISINQREAEIHKLRTNLDELKEENSKILLEFNFFKEKFFQLETDYDRTSNIQNHENENLRVQLQKLQTTENQEIHELSSKCQDLQQTLQNKINDLHQLNKLHIETYENFEQMKINFERQQKDFELHNKQANEEKRLNEERNKLDFDNLKDELRQKDEIIKKCIADKNALEKEKNIIIDELNNKICRIERAFSQPTKLVQPMMTLPQRVNSSDNNSSSECSIDNVAVAKPQARKPLENLSVQALSNIENKKVEQNPMQRDFKFKRPAQLTTSTQQSNVSTSRKRRNQPLRHTAATKTYNEFSLSSSDEDDDNESNSSIARLPWRPNNDCYIADTDESGGFAKVKRSKK